MFELRLCALLGIATRRQLKQVLSWPEYREWQSLYEYDPWGEERADWRMGMLAAAMLAPWSKKGQMPRPSEFMLHGPKKQAMTTTQLRAVWGQAKRAFDAADERKRES